MTLDELLEKTPIVLGEFTREVFRRADEAMLADNTSQLTACLLVALRAASVMHGMAAVLDLSTIDSFETLNRAAIEASNLLMNFRFDDKGTRYKIGYWFTGAKDNAWKADHKKLDEFLAKKGAEGIQLGMNWSKLSVLSHPTKYAADNSTVVIIHRLTGRLNGMDFTGKRADYALGVARLIAGATYDFDEWIPLRLDMARMPNAEDFMMNAEISAAPIVNAPANNPLPPHSVEPPKKKP